MASETEQERRETLADIVAEMRREVGDGKDTYCGKRVIRRMEDARVMQFCDRIEAAWRRERESLMLGPRSWEECIERYKKAREIHDDLY